VFLPFDTVQNLPEFVAALETSNYGFLVLIEYISVSSINIGILFLAFKKIKNAPLIMELNESQGMYYNWIKIMIVAIGLLHVIVFVITIMGSVDMGDFNFYLQFETLIYLVFFFVFTFSVMHFPIFAYTGNFEDLSNTTKHKYAKSSLSNSLDLFQQTKNVVNSEKLYLDFDLKLNTLADKLDKSIHHISQAINQNAKISFPDFINGFRIEEAKKKLLESKPDTILAISLDVGFNSKAAFYTAFKKNTQLTPTEFKKIHKVKKS
jgi:AraC-like DNA-binding protein